MQGVSKISRHGLETCITDTLVFFQDTHGQELTATPLRIARYVAVFEVYSPTCVLRTSEALRDFKIVVQERTIYAGRAVITSIVSTGTLLVCEAKLEDSWLDLEAFLPKLQGDVLRAGLVDFFRHWHRAYGILSEFKTVVSDLQMFLSDLRLWLDQVELGVRSTPAGDRAKLELELGAELGEETTPAIGAFFERFETVAERIDKQLPEHRAAHSSFAKRLLHPLLLCSPFLYRTFRKPLGYAGDYEMVNMICREPLEGSTLFAKIVNLWFLRQPPAEAHRNRIRFLVERISETILHHGTHGRPVNILSAGCGPAQEVQQFLAESPLANRAHFTLVDFDQETSEYTHRMLDSIKRRYSRTTPIEVLRKSVNQILKEASRSIHRLPQEQYDFVYCAGLFDYLSDPICRRLSRVLYDWVAPGGLFLTTNVDPSNPRRLTMDYIMDWHLIYRKGTELAGLGPECANSESRIIADQTGVNVHYLLRKPNHG